MKISIKLTLAIVISLSLTSLNAFADEPAQLKPSPGLILEIDLQTLNAQLQSAPTVHTYHESAKKKKSDPLSKNILRARKVLKRITSLRYKKNQKLRALIGKSSYTVQYTHKL